jgi:hypothetical protein
MAEFTPREEDEIKGYLAELAGALRSHNKEHAALIRAELKAIGYKDLELSKAEVAAADPVAERAVVSRKAAKRQPRQATAAEERGIAASVKAEAADKAAPQATAEQEAGIAASVKAEADDKAAADKAVPKPADSSLIFGGVPSELD